MFQTGSRLVLAVQPFTRPKRGILCPTSLKSEGAILGGRDFSPLPPDVRPTPYGAAIGSDGRDTTQSLPEVKRK